jgi:methionine sulfoxide reductase heme-binding subunit
MGWDAYNRRLGANPVEFVIHTTGTLTLIFLLLTLAVTPLRRLTEKQLLIKFRRTLGLYAFFYALLHMLSYTWFDKAFNLSKIFQDVLSRQFIAVGMASFLFMIPLAVTSSNRMIKRLGGSRWVKLHRSVYYISVGGVLHYWMSVKADTDGPMIFACILGALLGYRIFTSYMRQPTVNSLNIK